MHRVFIIIVAACLATLILSVQARAQDDTIDYIPDSIFMVGALVDGGTSALIGKEKILPFPFIYYHNKYVTLETTSLYLHPVDTGPFTLSAVGAMRVSNIEMSSDDRLKEFDRDFAFEVGGEASFSHSGFTLYGKYLTDVTDAHDGEEITIGLEWEKQLGKLRLTAGGGASHRSSELATFLYGITAKDSASGYTPFALPSGWYGFAEVRASYPLWGRWGLLLTATGERLPASAATSPIVGKRNTMEAGIGFTYTF